MSRETLERLAQRAGEDPEFFNELRADFEGALVNHGFDDLTDSELESLRQLRERSGALTDSQLRAELRALTG